MSVEPHLPDLPDLPDLLGVPISISIGAPPTAADRPSPPMPWHLRLRDTLSAYLPLLLMALLALASWWLVKNSPRPQAPVEQRALSSEPDYTMSQFALERFDAAGKLKLRIEGAQLRHIPATDLIEIENAVIHAVAPDGRVTLARAQRATGNGDGSEVQLIGGAEVDSVDAEGRPLLMRGEFLHAFLLTGRIKSHLPVLVRQGGSVLRAAGMEYDHVARRLDLKGPMRTQLTPRVPK